MSRAFVKEADEDRPPSDEELGVPAIEEPVLLTPAGFERLKAEFEQAQAEVARWRAASSPEDKAALTRARRRLRIAELQLAAAKVIDPAQHAGHTDSVAFGARVTVEDDAGERKSYSLVGASEADPARGFINVKSPLAEALMGQRVGDQVTWRRPAGDTVLKIVAIDYPPG
jgi:transcription elongation GreA/GreB family factor